MAKKATKKWASLSARITGVKGELETTENYIAKLEARKVKLQERISRMEAKASSTETVAA